MQFDAGHDNDDDLAETYDINVTPFIDVILVLLIIFMVAAPLATVNVAVDLPASSAEREPRPKEPIYLTLRKDLTLALGEQDVTRETLAAALQAAAHGDHDARIFLRADRGVSYGDLMATMDDLRNAGFLKVALVGLERPQ
ncbi:TonB system transport protein ExbD [Rhodopila sp.]|jgi:TonB system transport protein ExbD (group 1)|uniref:TonB system transport protein ExbD n=1 Tax=Rhodopila sp. TaxID=2480087 RepID=UPI002BEABAB1|nr:TonB system transport protein ExbD [Rhodopila sp.]HVZ07619.1 TonB system transport protein ExbD [Rhodopila sp.]